MNDLKIGDKVRVISDPKFIKLTGEDSIIGMTGTVKELNEVHANVEFDDDVGGGKGRWGGKDGHCFYVDNECLEEIEESEVKEMNDLEIGDRVRVVDDPTITRPTGYEVMAVIEGTVKELSETHVGVEFDYYADVKNNSWNGRFWHIPYDYLEKIEDTEKETKEEIKEETKAETMEQKILEVLREEIGVEIGEEFDVYENGEKQWTCKFEETGFSHEIDDEFRESGFWKQIVCKFHSYQFKKKPFVPEYGKDFFLLVEERDENNNIIFVEKRSVWVDSTVDCGMLALGNVFRSKEEALENKDKVLEKLEKLRRGEV